MTLLNCGYRFEYISSDWNDVSKDVGNNVKDACSDGIGVGMIGVVFVLIELVLE